jgi:CBS domain-containing protein
MGVVSARAILRLRADRALALSDEIACAESPSALRAAYEALPKLARGLLDEGVTATQIASVLGSTLRSVTARAASLAERELGPPPGRYALLVLGSGGRGESLLAPDQDNALICGDDAWFATLGQRIADILDVAGVPYCRGGVMAARPAWRHSLDNWGHELDKWIAQSAGDALLHIDIFFDFAVACGDAELGEALRRRALAAGADPGFLRFMAEEIANAGSALGPFDRWRSKQGRVDLKRGGLWPIVAFARILGLRSGSSATGTLERLTAAVAAGRLRAEDASHVATAFDLILAELLDQQLVDRESNRPLGATVEIARLPRDRRAKLKETLKLLEVIPLLLRDALSPDVGTG